MSSFIATTLDYINIDAWFYTGEKNEQFEKMFPFFRHGKQVGNLLTIYFDDSRIFFHKSKLIDYLTSLTIHPKILYLNRNGEDDLYPQSAPQGFIQMNGIKKSPYVAFNLGVGIWSTDFLTSVKRLN